MAAHDFGLTESAHSCYYTALGATLLSTRRFFPARFAFILLRKSKRLVYTRLPLRPRLVETHKQKNWILKKGVYSFNPIQLNLTWYQDCESLATSFKMMQVLVIYLLSCPFKLFIIKIPLSHVLSFHIFFDDEEEESRRLHCMSTSLWAAALRRRYTMVPCVSAWCFLYSPRREEREWVFHRCFSTAR